MIRVLSEYFLSLLNLFLNARFEVVFESKLESEQSLAIPVTSEALKALLGLFDFLSQIWNLREDLF